MDRGVFGSSRKDGFLVTGPGSSSNVKFCSEWVVLRFREWLAVLGGVCSARDVVELGCCPLRPAMYLDTVFSRNFALERSYSTFAYQEWNVNFGCRHKLQEVVGVGADRCPGPWNDSAGTGCPSRCFWSFARCA